MDVVKDLKKIAQGFAGEGILRSILSEKGHQFGQIDLMSICPKSGKTYFYEVKHQERFKGPPFDGHGLPPWQVDFRLKIAKAHNITPVLFIVEPGIDLMGEIVIFYASLIHLNNLPDDKKFLTNTGKRIIYHIAEFKHFKIKKSDFIINNN